MRVFVYWNLHKDCFSVRAEEGPNKGRVVAHSSSVSLAHVTFSVGQAGRLKSAIGPKSVHAGMRGQLVSLETESHEGMRAVTYNPRKYETFVTRDTLEPIHTATRVIGLTIDGRAQCFAV